jgi:hypothetical protein
MAQLADRVIEHRRVVGVQNRLHRKYLGMTAKRFHCAEDNGLSADRPVLLWPARTGAKAAPGGDKDGGGPLGFRHWFRLIGNSGGGTAEIGLGTALIMPGSENQRDFR